MKIIVPTVLTSSNFVYSNVPNSGYNDYSEETTYSISGIIRYSGDTYISLQDNNSGYNPYTESGYWSGYLVPESIYSGWVSGTEYASGTTVTYDHKIYEASRANSGTNIPGTTAAYLDWFSLGATEQWAPFDKLVGGDVVPNYEKITYTIRPGKVNGIACFNAVGNYIRVTLRNLDNPSSSGYSGTRSLISTIDPTSETGLAEIDNWYDYFFSENEYITDCVFLFEDYTYKNPEITIEIVGAQSGYASIGEIVLGEVFELGFLQASPSFSITDYSRKEVDEYGNYTVIERAYSKKIDIRVIAMTNSLNNIVKTLAKARATPVVWIPSTESSYENLLLIYGYYKDFNMVIPHHLWAEMNLQIEGLI